MSLDRRIKKGLKGHTQTVDFSSVMVVDHDDHSKFTSKCIHVHRYRHSHWPARYLSVFPGVVDTAAEDIHTFHPRFSTHPRTQILGRPSVSFHVQIESIFMSYFLSITGSQTKFSKSGFLLRATGSILEQRAIELRAIHAVDLPVGEIANRDLTAQFIADTTDQVLQATAVLLLTPVTKESVPTLLLTLLERLPDNSFFDKPVLLFATGGLPAHVPLLERSLRHVRLGTTTIAARVHIGPGNWITVANDRPRLSRSAETEIAYSIGIVLRRIQLRESKDFSRELARR
jgi:NAD(P)H-dependent FMN reductase